MGFNLGQQGWREPVGWPRAARPPVHASGLCYTYSSLWLLPLSSVQSLSHVRLFAIPWTVACQASLSITNSQSLLHLISIKSVMPSNHLILCCSLLFLPSIFPRIRVFSNESVLWCP